MIISAPVMSIKTWWRLVNQDKTLLRSMEDERIAQLRLRGQVLDIGGGATFDYANIIQIEGRLDSVNISDDAKPTFVADLNKRLPIADEAYDNVICFNTLEHIYDDQFATRELLRVLRTNGRFILTVPYFFPRHGRYGDYHRHTAEYWERELCTLGLDSQDFIIQPLLYSRLSSALAVLPWFRGGLRGKLAKAVVLFAAWAGCKSVSHDSKSSRATDYALGFYIDGIKSPR